MIYAPVLIPTLYRFTHFKNLIESLKRNAWCKYTELFIAVDYPPSEKYREGWNSICEYLKTEDFSDFKNLTIIERFKNYGAIDNGDTLVYEVFEIYDRLILIPDDVIVSPNFIEYMDKCLDHYEQDKDVIAVCGYSYPVNWSVSPSYASCFKQQINCAVWGIGYWKEKYNSALACLSSGKVLSDYPNYIKTRKYKKMIDASIREYVEASCYKWCYGHQWLLNMSDIGLRAYIGVMDKYAISPTISKVKNFGFDGSGIYCSSDDNVPNMFSLDHQEIDQNSIFDLVESKAKDDGTNRDLLNQFDYRTKGQMKKAVRLIWISKNISIESAKVYCLLTLPFDFAKRAVNKYLRI